MGHKKFILALTIILLLALVLPYNVFAQKSKPLPPKVVRLIVEEDYGEAKGVRLPIKEEVSEVLSRVGAVVVGEGASTYEATLTVKIKGQTLKE